MSNTTIDSQSISDSSDSQSSKISLYTIILIVIILILCYWLMGGEEYAPMPFMNASSKYLWTKADDYLLKAEQGY